MNNLFVPYKLAKLAKDYNFTERCFGYYQHENCEYVDEPYGCSLHGIRIDDTLAPLYQQLIDWFREKHYLHLIINVECSVNEIYGYTWGIHRIMAVEKPFSSSQDTYDDYYAALQAGLHELFNQIKT